MKTKLKHLLFLEFIATYAAILAWAVVPEEQRDFLGAWIFMNKFYALTVVTYLIFNKLAEKIL